MPLDRPPTSLLRDSSLFLDFDGTLVDLAPTPDAIVVGDDLRPLLARLQAALQGRIALVSGRAVADVRDRIHPLNLAIGGSHGLEHMRSTGHVDAASAPAGLAQAIAEFRRIEAAHEGVLVEEKPAGVALHYRTAPDAEAICLGVAERMAGVTGLGIQLGKMVVELKDPRGDKGEALKRFMAEQPFAGTSPVFVGDDLTDEHAFAAASDLGGAGVLVGAERPTSAVYRLDDVTDVLRWLSQAAEELQ